MTEVSTMLPPCRIASTQHSIDFNHNRVERNNESNQINMIGITKLKCREWKILHISRCKGLSFGNFFLLGTNIRKNSLH